MIHNGIETWIFLNAFGDFGANEKELTLIESLLIFYQQNFAGNQLK